MGNGCSGIRSRAIPVLPTNLGPRPRTIARLDIKGPNVIKGIQFEGLRVMGDPSLLARRYYLDGVQEILLIDTVATLYGRNSLSALVKETVRDVFVPLTVGGGITSVAGARTLLAAGADKVAVNSGALNRPALLQELAQEFGAQCVVLSLQAKRSGQRWEALSEAGREHSGRDALEWLCEAVELGAGELLVTSVDRDGTGRGYDLDLIREVEKVSTVPIIASGGYGSLGNLRDLLHVASPEGIAIGGAAHRQEASFREIRRFLESMWSGEA